MDSPSSRCRSCASGPSARRSARSPCCSAERFVQAARHGEARARSAAVGSTSGSWRLGLRRHRAMVVHCHEHQALAAAWVIARLTRARLIYDAHEMTELNRKGFGGTSRRGFGVDRAPLPRPGRCRQRSTVGERLRKALERRGAHHVVVVGNWKDERDYVAQPVEDRVLRASLTIPEGALVVAYIGELDARRDVRVLLDAVATRPEVHLVIAGRGALEREVKAIAGEHPNIHWLGWLSLRDVPRYTRIADVIYCSVNGDLLQAEYFAPNKFFEVGACCQQSDHRAGRHGRDERHPRVDRRWSSPR